MQNIQESIAPDASETPKESNSISPRKNDSADLIGCEQCTRLKEVNTALYAALKDCVKRMAKCQEWARISGGSESWKILDTSDARAALAAAEKGS